MARKKVESKKQCTMCEKEKKPSFFYSHSSVLYTDGRFPVCKECLTSLVDEEDYRTVMKIMRMIDRPFLYDLWNSSVDEAERNKWSIFSAYMKNLGMHQYRNFTWEDSRFDADTVNRQSQKSKMDLDDEVLERWRGWEDKKIPVLENFYQDLVSTYEHKTPIQRNLYRNMAIAQMQADEAIANGKTNDYNRLMKTISDLMNDAKIKPLQETGHEDGGIDTWGEWIKRIEEEEPIPEPKDEFKDVDGIRKYIDKWFIDHFSKVFGLTDVNDVSEEDLLDEKEGSS